MYRSIFLKNGDEWACESTGCSHAGYGVFFRNRADGNWRQFTGTGQTPAFETPQQFSRFIHRNYAEPDGAPLPRMVRHDWKD